MSILSPHTVEECIVYILRKGEKRTTQLLNEVQLIKKGITKQAFYKAFRKLKSEEIAITYKKKISLNSAWIIKLGEFLNTVELSYARQPKSFSFISLADRESVSYIFTTVRALDTFWGHAQRILFQNTSVHEPIFSYDPHYWFYVAREKSEKILLKDIVQNKRQFLMTVGGDTALDKLIRKDFQTDYLQYNIDRIFPLEMYYLTVVGEFIIEVFLDARVAQTVEDIFEQSISITPEIIERLQQLLVGNGKNKIKISHHQKRAQILRKKFEKNFFIKQSE